MVLGKRADFYHRLLWNFNSIPTAGDAGDSALCRLLKAISPPPQTVSATTCAPFVGNLLGSIVDLAIGAHLTRALVVRELPTTRFPGRLTAAGLLNGAARGVAHASRRVWPVCILGMSAPPVVAPLLPCGPPSRRSDHPTAPGKPLPLCAGCDGPGSRSSGSARNRAAARAG